MELERRNKMEYKIYCNGKLIAQFVNESDRDLCLDLLERVYEDCIFSK